MIMARFIWSPKSFFTAINESYIATAFVKQERLDAVIFIGYHPSPK